MMDDIEGSAEVNQCQKTDVTPINRLQEMAVTLTSAVAAL